MFHETYDHGSVAVLTVTLPGESKKVYTFNEPQKGDHCIDLKKLT